MNQINPSQTIALYQPMLHAVALKLLKCKADAEDVVQETFIKWLNAEHEKIQNTKAYLIKAVTNNCLNHIQAIKRKKEQCLESLQWPDFIEKIRDSDFSTVEIEQKLTHAFSLLQHKLEPLERAVYVLKEAFDFDYQALQEILNKKQDHCRQLFCRAKKKLSSDPRKSEPVASPSTPLFQSFKESCDVGHLKEVIAALQNDICLALQKKK